MIQENTPLAKHLIKKGTQISSDDLCYLDSRSAEIKDIKYIDTMAITAMMGGFGASMGTSMSKEDLNAKMNASEYYNTNFDDAINAIVGRCVTEDISQYQIIEKSQIEAPFDKYTREKEEQAKKDEEIRQAKLEQLKKSMNETVQKNLSAKDFHQDDIAQEDDTLRDQMKNNIWL